MCVDEVIVFEELVDDAVLAEVIPMRCTRQLSVAQWASLMARRTQAGSGSLTGRSGHIDRSTAGADDPLEYRVPVHQAGKATGGRLDQGDRHHLSEAAQREEDHS